MYAPLEAVESLAQHVGQVEVIGYAEVAGFIPIIWIGVNTGEIEH
jgi:hypothetical protein